MEIKLNNKNTGLLTITYFYIRFFREIQFFYGRNVLFLEKAPAGPWNDASFSVGVTGLISISLIYIAWYKWKFETYGIVPWLNLWKDVRGSGLRITVSGFLTIAFTWTFAE